MQDNVLESLAVVKQGVVSLYSLPPEGQKDDTLQSRITRVGFTVHRLVYSFRNRCFAVILSDAGCYYLALLDGSTYEITDTVPLDINETGISLISVETDVGEIIVMGTSKEDSQSEFSETGRLLVFHITISLQLVLAQQETTSGGVAQIRAFEKGIIAAIHNQVAYFRWQADHTDTMHMHHAASFYCRTLCIDLCAEGRSVLVVEPEASCLLIEFDSVKGTFGEVARDPYLPKYVTATAMVDEGLVIAADMEGNLHLLKESENVWANESKGTFADYGGMGLGDCIDSMVEGICK